MLRIIVFIFSFAFVFYCTYVRFDNPELTETQLFLKIFGIKNGED